MKMFFASVICLFLCFIGGRIQCSSVPELISAASSRYAYTTLVGVAACGENETECPTGCCPHKYAVCCSDGVSCCPMGSICVPVIGICLKWVNSEGEVALTSEKSTQVQSPLLLPCPPGHTDCGYAGCCPLENATCCEDRLHCCKNGYKCDLVNSRCIKDFTAEDGSVTTLLQPLAKMSRKSPYRSCPGGNRICPSYKRCCLNDNGEWGCCPDPTLPQIRYGEGECCNTVFGRDCCPNFAPHCTLLGCIY